MRTLVVGPVGSPSDNGAALLAALASLTSASPFNRYLLRLEPGTYAIGDEGLTMKSGVDIEGSGKTATFVHGTGTFVVRLASQTELRDLTVRGLGNHPNQSAVWAPNTVARIQNVHVDVSGGPSGNFGIQITDGDVTIEDSSFRAYGAATNYAILVTGSSPDVRLDRVTAVATGGATGNDGLRALGGGVRARSFRAEVAGTGGGLCHGILASNAALELQEFAVEVEGCEDAVGIGAGDSAGGAAASFRIERGRVDVGTPVGGTAVGLEAETNGGSGELSIASVDVLVTGSIECPAPLVCIATDEVTGIEIDGALSQERLDDLHVVVSGGGTTRGVYVHGGGAHTFRRLTARATALVVGLARGVHVDDSNVVIDQSYLRAAAPFDAVGLLVTDGDVNLGGGRAIAEGIGSLGAWIVNDSTFAAIGAYLRGDDRPAYGSGGALLFITLTEVFTGGDVVVSPGGVVVCKAVTLNSQFFYADTYP